VERTRWDKWCLYSYYSRGKSAEFSVAIVVHKSIVRSDVKKIVSDDNIVAPKLQAGPVSFL
jgi:hypothetical protein